MIKIINVDDSLSAIPRGVLLFDKQ